MPERVLRFFQKLATDPKLAEHFERDSKGALAAHDLTDEEREVISSRNMIELAKRLELGDPPPEEEPPGHRRKKPAKKKAAKKRTKK